MARAHRNVLLVTADQWRGDCLSAAGHPLVETPSFDALANEGVRFARHYTVCAPCGPARASLLTGMYLHNHRSVRNGTPLEDRFTNVAREVRRAGYRPVLFGYTDTSLDPRVYPLDEVTRHGYENLMPGFEEGLLLPGERPRAWIDDLKAKGYDVNDRDDAFAPAAASPPGYGRTFAPAKYTSDDSQTAFLARRAMEYIDRAAPGWFVHLSWLRPHPPFIAPEPWNRRYRAVDVPAPVRAASPAREAALHPWLAAALGPHGDWYEHWVREAMTGERYDDEVRQLRATYYGLVGKVDHYFGALMDFLRVTRRLDDTLVVLTSDHGELLGDHYLFGKRGWFDAAFQVPLLVRDPDLPRARRGAVVEGFTESVDVMPTILEWLGLPLPRQCDGRSLLPVMAGAPAADAAFFEYDFRNDDAAGGAAAELGLGADQCLLNAVRTERYKYVHFPALPPLFFDLAADPGELDDRTGDHACRDAMMEHAGRLLSWRMTSTSRGLTHLKVARDGVHDLSRAPGDQPSTSAMDLR